jgi:hypothetical protein
MFAAVIDCADVATAHGDTYAACETVTGFDASVNCAVREEGVLLGSTVIATVVEPTPESVARCIQDGTPELLHEQPDPAFTRSETTVPALDCTPDQDGATENVHAKFAITVAGLDNTSCPFDPAPVKPAKAYPEADSAVRLTTAPAG